MNEVSRATLVTRRYVFKPFTAKQTSSQKYIAETKSSLRCWPRGLDLYGTLAREVPRMMGLFHFIQPRPRSTVP